MKVISGEPLAPQQLGAKLWNAEYKGKTIGQWTTDAWLESETGGDSEHESELEELGLLALLDPEHLYFMHLHK